MADPDLDATLTCGRFTLACTPATGANLTVPGIIAVPLAPSTIAHLRHQLRK